MPLHTTKQYRLNPKGRLPEKPLKLTFRHKQRYHSDQHTILISSVSWNFKNSYGGVKQRTYTIYIRSLSPRLSTERDAEQLKL